jgi:nucleotide-binding universal stress UspA family protein
MPLYRTILCAVDFSDHSRHALEVSAHIAKHCSARIVAFHAIEPLLAQACDEGQLCADAETELKAFVTAATGNVASDIVVRVGDPDDAILSCAKERTVDLIVMGTQGLGGFRKAFFGSVTEKVLRGAFVPVLAVKSSVPVVIPSGIVAAVHLDDTARPVLEYAAAFAGEFKIPLTALHVVPAVQALPQYTDALAAAQADRIERATARLQEDVAVLKGVVKPEIEVRAGDVAHEIGELVKARPGILLAIGTGGSRMLHRPGSTAYRVLSLTAAPVLAIPDKP